ncbi:MAG: LD-carboxypeptidase [Alphaproteobacteria bacterium]|nr:MAG: LD-carboxypeptidase [Alphaproteobacteria bacterium]
MNITPPAFQAGDTVGVFAPSSWVERDDIEKSKALLESRGFQVFVHPQTYERENQSAGNHLQKSLAFQGLWQRKDIKAIWAAGGGNRCTHLLETINFARLDKTPKILIGFSDVTSLLNAITAHTNITTFHGPVFKNLYKYKQLDHLIDLLGGALTTYPMTKDNVLREGKAEGRLIGGNLSLFQYLPQTLPDDFYKDSILFLEDCNEELSSIDRMLLHLKRLGVLNEINALVFGQFTDILETGTPFGYTLDDIIQEHIGDAQYPVLHNMPFGHGKDIYTFPIGTRASIDTQTNEFTLLDAATAKL